MSNKNILIVFASNSGSTMLTATLISDVLLSSLHTVKILRAAAASSEDIKNADVILFGSPSWKVNGLEGQPHETMTELFDRLSDVSLHGKSVALFGCGDTAYTHFCGAVDHMGDMVARLQGTACIDPLRVDSFYFDLKRNKTRIESWAKKLAILLEKV